MRILCPNCGFGREMDLAKIPPRAQMATCPRCAHKFRFRVVDDLPPAAPPSPAQPEYGQPKPGQPGAGQDQPQPMDPMAAQRAAAEQAWRHIQGVKPEAPKPDAASSDIPSADAASPTGSAGPAESTDAPPQQTEAPAQQPEPWSAQASQTFVVGAGADFAASSVPFEDLPRHGFFPGLWRTVTAVLKTPSAFFRDMPVSGGMAKPLIFHLLLAEFMVLCQYVWGLGSMGALSQYTGSKELMDLGMGMAGSGPILILVFYPLMLVLRLMFMTGIIHGLLLLVLRFAGGQGRGAEATFRVLCYSAAPLIFGIVPFFGPLLGGIWSVGLTVIGLREAHRTRGSVAMFAVLLPILLLLAAALGLMQAGMKG